MRLNAKHGLLCSLLLGCASEAPGATLPPSSPAATVPPITVPAATPPSEPDAGVAPPVDAGAPITAISTLTMTAIPLPGAVAPVFFDYLAADAANGRIWVPVGSTGSLDLLDVASRTFSKVEGFKTAEKETHGKKRVVGPSAVAVGDGVVYVGNRATSEVCAVDTKKMKIARCVTVAGGTDGVAYVASTKEVWVTTPGNRVLVVLDGATLKSKAVIKTGGEPEGYASDDTRGLFFTNLEDNGSTLVFDVKSHALKATWNASCGSDGPRGLAIDPARGFLFVACTDHVQVLDEGHDGAPLGKVDAGEGVDNLDYVPSAGLLVIAAGKAARVTLAHIDDKGSPMIVATGATALGARNAVADANGNAYVVDPQGARLLVMAK